MGKVVTWSLSFSRCSIKNSDHEAFHRLSSETTPTLQFNKCQMIFKTHTFSIYPQNQCVQNFNSSSALAGNLKHLSTIATLKGSLLATSWPNVCMQSSGSSNPWQQPTYENGKLMIRSTLSLWENRRVCHTQPGVAWPSFVPKPFDCYFASAWKITIDQYGDLQHREAHCKNFVRKHDRRMEMHWPCQRAGSVNNSWWCRILHQVSCHILMDSVQQLSL